MNEIGQKIHDLRTKKHMTLEELGRKVGVGKSTVRKWETGMIANMKNDKIALLSSALEINPLYLMGWTDDENEPLFYAAFSGAGRSDPRVQYYMDLLKSREVNMDNLSEKEQLLVEYYRASDERTRSIVDLALGIQDVED